MTRAETASLYRCADCGHGGNLTAWGYATVHGPLSASGNDLTSFDWDEVTDVAEDSIQCNIDGHEGSEIEKRIDGQWCRWRSCPYCTGNGRRDGQSCPGPGFRPITAGPRDPLAHSGWLPASAPPPGSALDKDGHVFTRPRTGLPQCRLCWAPVGSIAADEPCPGDKNGCPVVVSEGNSDTAYRRHGRDEWFCGQPGKMNADFTEWRCARGHVITRAGHVPAGQDHHRVCPLANFRKRCPWEVLA